MKNFQSGDGALLEVRVAHILYPIGHFFFNKMRCSGLDENENPLYFIFYGRCKIDEWSRCQCSPRKPSHVQLCMSITSQFILWDNVNVDRSHNTTIKLNLQCTTVKRSDLLGIEKRKTQSQDKRKILRNLFAASLEIVLDARFNRCWVSSKVCLH